MINFNFKLNNSRTENSNLMNFLVNIRKDLKNSNLKERD